MNYQQAIVAVIKQIRFRSVAAAADATATTVLVAGSGFSSFCPAVAATTDLVDSAFPTDAVVDVAVKAATTMADAVAGSGFSSFCPAVATTTAVDAAAANVLISEGPFYTDPYNLYGFCSVMHLRRA